MARDSSFSDWLQETRTATPNRWGVSVPAAAAALLFTLAVLAVAAVLLLRPSPAPVDDVAPAIEPVASAAAQPPPTVGPAPSASSPGPQLRVYVVGQVREAGVVSLPAGARVEDALEAAGGATGKADLTVVNLARPVVDGEQIVVPKPGERVAAAPPAAASPGGVGSAAAPGAPVNLNTATAADLDALPGVGPVIAERIVAWRQENGGFRAVDDLGEVAGIGDATLTRLRPLVTV